MNCTGHLKRHGLTKYIYKDVYIYIYPYNLATLTKKKKKK